MMCNNLFVLANTAGLSVQRSKHLLHSYKSAKFHVTIVTKTDKRDKLLYRIVGLGELKRTVVDPVI